jgi:hypothetical protein
MMRSRVWLGLAWLAAVNAAVMGGARWNRSRVAQQITLTERELPPDLLENGSREENGALSLRLAWTPERSAPLLPAGRATVAQLRAMGVDTSIAADDPQAIAFYGSMPARPVFVALVCDGEPWRDLMAGEALKIARLESDAGAGKKASEALQRRREALERDRIGGSRLVAVDIDADAAALRSRHPGAEFLLWPAAVQPAIHGLRNRRSPPHEHGPDDGDETPPVGKPFLAGDIELRGEEIHVPRPFRAVLDAFLRHRIAAAGPAPAHAPRYAVTLRIGRRREPWIAAVEPLPGEGKS